MTGQLYILKQPRYAYPWPGSTRVVRVLAQWFRRRGHRSGPRNVLVEIMYDNGSPTPQPERFVRPARGLRRWKDDCEHSWDLFP